MAYSAVFLTRTEQIQEAVKSAKFLNLVNDYAQQHSFPLLYETFELPTDNRMQTNVTETVALVKGAKNQHKLENPSATEIIFQRDRVALNGAIASPSFIKNSRNQTQSDVALEGHMGEDLCYKHT